MTSFKPHLIRAYYAWFIENNLRSFLLLALAGLPQADLLVIDKNESTISLDISPQATRDLIISEHKITGRMSMRGKIIDFNLPMENILAIYAEGTSIGEFFTKNPKIPKLKPKIKIIR